MMGKTQVPCHQCGKMILRYPSMIRERNFCGNPCRLLWFGKWTKEVMNVPGHSAGHKAPHLTALNSARRNTKRPARLRDNREHKSNVALSEYNAIRNRTDNPMWHAETREKVAKTLRDRGEGRTYRKYHGRHEHRVVAEALLGRPLRKGEVVHHIDHNKRNNAPENLMVFSSQADHANFHFSKGGDAKCVPLK